MEKFKLECEQDIREVLKDTKYEGALLGDYDFATYRYGDFTPPILDSGSFIINDGDGDFKLSRHCYLNKSMTRTDTSAFDDVDTEIIDAMINAQAAKIKTDYQQLMKAADDVQASILYLMCLKRIRQGRNLVPVIHTGNKWEKRADSMDRNSAVRSNMVYQMHYSIYRETRWNSTTRKSEPTGICRLSWSVGVQSPALGEPRSMASQERRFKNEDELQKYLDGRIKAYDKFFQEVSPAVPLDYLDHFMYAGKLLPGYHVEEETKDGQ